MTGPTDAPGRSCATDHDSTPAAGPTPWRVLVVSVRGPRYLIGGSPTRPIDEVIPAGAGTHFATFDEIERYVQRHLRGVSSYWQVQIIDAAGTVVCRGVRSGPNGTGDRWTWHRMS